MFINKNSIIINGVSMGQYLTEAKYGYNKLWSSDSGRNLAGVMTGTLVGIFPKLILQFRRLTKAELVNAIEMQLIQMAQNIPKYLSRSHS
jgi:hypothetical protein